MDQQRQEVLLRMHQFYAEEARHQRQMMWETAKWFTLILTGLAALWVQKYFDAFNNHLDAYVTLVLIVISLVGIVLSLTCILLLRSFYRANMKYITMFAKVEEEVRLEPRRTPERDRAFFPGDKYINWYQYMNDRACRDEAAGEGYTSRLFVEKKMCDGLPRLLENFLHGGQRDLTIYDLAGFVFYLFAVIFSLGLFLILWRHIPMAISREHIGIILTILGTVLVAFSVRIKRQYDKELRKVADEAKTRHPDLVEPTETYIVRSLFWIGLILVAVGSALQW
jgi:hypothetical protein